MPATPSHVVGTFMWPELATSDIAAARDFYTSILGWEVKEVPMGEMGTYYIFTKNGCEVAAGYQKGPDMAHVPNHWGAYVRVDDADAAAEKAKTLGGQVVMGPFDVDASGRKHGRMAVIADTVGAVFCVWQPIEHAGVGLLAEPGALAWTQLNSKDTAKAKTFYTQMFGWTFRDDPDPMGGTYTTWMKSDGVAGGMMAMPAEAPAPSHWLGYWAVDDVDAAHAKAVSMGAMSFVPPTSIPGMGRFAVLADPQGAATAFVAFEKPGA